MFIEEREGAVLMIDEVDNILLDEFDIQFHYFYDAMGVQEECTSALLYDEHSSLTIQSNPFRFLLRADKGRHSYKLLLYQIGDNSLELCTKKIKTTGIKVLQFQSILLL